MYILNSILPCLSTLSLSFQKGGFNLSRVPFSIQLCITKINEIFQRKQPIIEINGDWKIIATLFSTSPEFSSSSRFEMETLLHSYSYENCLEKKS